MTEVTLELDGRASQTINDLMQHYKLDNKAQVFSKAIAILKLAAYVDMTHGELFARKGTSETRLII